MFKKPTAAKGAAEGTEKTGKQSGPSSDTGLAGILGDITYLMINSKSHRHLFVSDLEWLVMPALMLRQMRVFRNERRPLAYISWAFLDAEAEKRLLSGQGRVAPRDWKSGQHPWIIDTISSGGSVYPLLRVVQEQVFKGQDVRLLRPGKDKGGFEGVLLAEVLKNIKAKPIEKNQ